MNTLLNQSFMSWMAWELLNGVFIAIIVLGIAKIIRYIRKITK